MTHLMTGDPAAARAEFARAIAAAAAPAERMSLMRWKAITRLYAGDARASVRELADVAAAADAEGVPAEAQAAHEEMALIDAYSGDPNAVATHLAAAAAGEPPATYHAVRAIVCARTGELDAARSSVRAFEALSPADALPHALNALIALDGRDLPAAERELALVPPTHLLTKAVRADLLMRRGRRAEAAALRQEVLASPIERDGDGRIDNLKLAARLHAARLFEGRGNGDEGMGMREWGRGNREEGIGTREWG